ncbi:LysR family transcriptional regulator [Nonomuraea sp. NPDC050536]|uniref:LysR family transcriptional regulator n=1 Tax=Nonomuraea sp. NPDC050536 TaxID=3364366 RepID=UPI0037CA9414
MELREIEIFLTLAEELHFGRAAERMYLSQSRVSQTIRRHGDARGRAAVRTYLPSRAADPAG